MSCSQPKSHADLAADFVKKRIWCFANTEKDAAVRAVLARLRRGVGATPGADPEIWADTLGEMPEELISPNGIPTKGEWAVHIALTLYAVHQQGADPKSQCMHRDNNSLGKAIQILANRKGEGGEDAVTRRFNAMATSESIEEFAHHLRSMIQQLKAEGISLNYEQLTRDLYWFQYPDMRDKLRLRWGQDYYRSYSVSDTSDADV